MYGQAEAISLPPGRPITRIVVSLVSGSKTLHVLLAAPGIALGQAKLLRPLADMELPTKALTPTPTAKWMEGAVLILAGGRATAHANLLLRPDLGVVPCAWGQFTEQSTLSDTLCF